MRYTKLNKPASQREPLNSRQVKNNAGGYVYQVSDIERLTRFLILGSDQPTYYAGVHKLTRENAQVIEELWKKNPEITANLIAQVSMMGRAPKNDPAIFATAIGACIPGVSSFALKILPSVCRTASHLFSFLAAIEGQRGWGRALCRSIADWYETKDADALAYQMIKYRQRDGYTHKRVIELSHPRVKGDEGKGAMLRHARGKEDIDLEKLPGLYRTFLKAQGDIKAKELVELILNYRLPWEAVPTQALKDPKVIEAIIPHMPMKALLRHLGLWSHTGLLTRERLRPFTDPSTLAKARIHPYAILLALVTYQEGQGLRSEWTPLSHVAEILNESFYLAFQAVEPSNSRIMIGLDVSSSMDGNHIQGGPLSAAQASAAMCLMTIATEPEVTTMAFSDQLVPINLHKRMAIEDVMQRVRKISFGATDCSKPMIYARDQRALIDAFVIYTDNETWAGRVHPVKALEQYKQSSGINAKMIVVGMTSTGFTIADPQSKSMLDVVGFDASAPRLIADFIAGRV